MSDKAKGGCIVSLGGLVGLFVLAWLLFLAGCENLATRQFGCSKKVELPAGRKLEDAHWKTFDFWYRHRTMRPDEKPETHVYEEDSLFGIFQGKVTIIEKAAEPEKK